jgi:hypothetical protein
MRPPILFRNQTFDFADVATHLQQYVAKRLQFLHEALLLIRRSSPGQGLGKRPAEASDSNDIPNNLSFSRHRVHSWVLVRYRLTMMWAWWLCQASQDKAELERLPIKKPVMQALCDAWD